MTSRARGSSIEVVGEVGQPMLDARAREGGAGARETLVARWHQATCWFLDEHRTGAADHRHRLWQLLMLELWFERFVDQDGWPAWQGPGTRAAVAAAAPAGATPVRGAA